MTDESPFEALFDGRRVNMAGLIERLRFCASDPMWADHAEVSKVLLSKAADTLASIKEADELFMVLDEIDREFPGGASWFISKGKTHALENLYGCQLMFGTDEIIGEGEGDTAAEAIREALRSYHFSALAKITALKESAND